MQPFCNCVEISVGSARFDLSVKTIEIAPRQIFAQCSGEKRVYVYDEMGICDMGKCGWPPDSDMSADGLQVSASHILFISFNLFRISVHSQKQANSR